MDDYDVEYERWKLIVEQLEKITDVLTAIRDRLPEPPGHISLSMPPAPECEHELHASYGPNGDYILWCSKCEKEIR